jgi:hypothetical protein
MFKKHLPYSQAEVAEQIRQYEQLYRLQDKPAANVAYQVLMFMQNKNITYLNRKK